MPSPTALTSAQLPPEELARLNATPMRGGATPGPGSAAASAPAAVPGSGLGADNKGFKLLQKMGWKEGQGIGGAPGGGSGGGVGSSSAAAALPPLPGPPPPVTGGGGLGLGATREGDVAEDDDEFTRYRKRSAWGGSQHWAGWAAVGGRLRQLPQCCARLSAALVLLITLLPLPVSTLECSADCVQVSAQPPGQPAQGVLLKPGGASSTSLRGRRPTRAVPDPGMQRPLCCLRCEQLQAHLPALPAKL